MEFFLNFSIKEMLENIFNSYKVSYLYNFNYFFKNKIDEVLKYVDFKFSMISNKILRILENEIMEKSEKLEILKSLKIDNSFNNFPIKLIEKNMLNVTKK